MPGVGPAFRDENRKCGDQHYRTQTTRQQKSFHLFERDDIKISRSNPPDRQDYNPPPHLLSVRTPGDRQFALNIDSIDSQEPNNVAIHSANSHKG